jgi:hypothetical protein
VPTALGPDGRLYFASIDSEPCEGGFRATVVRVVLLNTTSAGEMDGVVIPDSIGTTKRAAEQLAEIRFKTWATLRTP